MKKMKVLLTGANGQLGQDVLREFSRLDVTVIGPSSSEMDIRKIDDVSTAFDAVHPDAVIHCAAYNQVDRAESEPEACRAVNVIGVQNITTLSLEYGAYLIAISSDYVFDGKKEGPYETDDPKNPLSVYGQSKADGEEIVMNANSENAVIRTSWLYGPREHNFVEAILRKGKESKQISVVSDQIGSPTYTADLARLIADFTLQRIPGVFHGTNEGFCSRAEFAKMILRDAALPCIVQEILSEELPTPAQRPKNSRLSKRSLDQQGLMRLPPWQESLERYILKIPIAKEGNR